MVMISPRSPSPLPPTPHPGISLPLTPTDRKYKEHSPSIPWKRLLPILMYRVADAAVYAVIFPFISEMITSFDAPLDKIGLYAGLGEGMLMVVEAIVCPFFAKASDKYGRRITTLIGFLPVIIASTLAGFSTKVWHVILWRGLMGIDPITITGKSLTSEISNPLNRTKIFALYSPAFASGFMFGAFVGGQMAHPYGRMPWWLGGKTETWRIYPYALPCVVVGSVGVLATIVGMLWLPETRPPRLSLPKLDEEEYGSDQPKPTYRDALRAGGFAVITTVFCFFQLATFSFDAIYSVYTYTPVNLGGLGLPVNKIGILLAAYSFSFIIFTPFILPRLTARLGDIPTMIISLSAWPIIALCLPTAQYFAQAHRGVMWILIFVQQMSKVLGSFAWPLCDMLFLAAFDDQPHLRSTGAAISTIAGSIGRAIGPSMSGWIYSVSTSHPSGTLGRQVYWVIYLVMGIIPIFMARKWLMNDQIDVDRTEYETVPLSPTTPLRASATESRDGEGRYE